VKHVQLGSAYQRGDAMLAAGLSGFPQIEEHARGQSIL
jgi:hypothetical protein